MNSGQGKPTGSRSYTSGQSYPYNLLDRYGDKIESLIKDINKKDPDYVLALSRTGPRMLKLFEHENETTIRPDIISEKSLAFMEEEEINGSHVVIFDDIVIAGTTLTTNINNFIKHYDPNPLEIISLAVDEETIAPALLSDEKLGVLPNDDVTIEFGDYEFTFRCYKKLLRKERFTYSRISTHALRRLNKPYDVDYPIFNVIPDLQDYNELIDYEKTVETTTSKQREAGFSGYTVFVDRDFAADFCSSVFEELPKLPSISKLRVIFDRNTSKMVVTPMLLLSLDEEQLTTASVFDESFGEFNSIIEQAQREFDIDDERSLFRLAWYLGNYIFGYYAAERFEDQGIQIFPDVEPVSTIKFDDISILFGERFGRWLFQELVDVGPLPELHEIQTGDGREWESGFDFESPETTRLFEHTKLDFTYESYVKVLDERLNTHNSLHVQVEQLFETLYSNVEMPQQMEISAETSLEEVIEYNYRLKGGFSINQIASIISEMNDVNRSDEELRRHLSLATDLLVDKGIQITQFDKTDEGHFQRVYRHGETATVNYKRFKLVMKEVLKEILGEGNTLRVKPLEKITVLVWKYLCESGCVDELKPTNPDEDIVTINHTFLPYGHTLDIVENIDDATFNNTSSVPSPENIVLEGSEEVSGEKFRAWALNEKLIKPTEGDKYTLSTEVLVNTERPEPSDIPGFGKVHYNDTPVDTLTNLASILYEIHHEVDDSPNEEFHYLLTLSTCTDMKTYLFAIREEFRALYNSAEWGLYRPLTQAEKLLNNSNDNPDLSERQKFSEAGEQLRVKADRWNNIEDTVEDIRHYLRSSRIRTSKDDASLNFIEKLVDNIEHERSVAEETTRLHQDQIAFKQFTEAYRQFNCIFVRIVDIFHELAKSYVLYGEEDDMESLLVQLEEEIQQWNSLLADREEVTYCDFALPSDLQRIESHRELVSDITDVDQLDTAPPVNDESSLSDLVSEWLPSLNSTAGNELSEILLALHGELDDIRRTLRSIYSHVYGSNHFRENVHGFRPSIFEPERGEYVICGCAGTRKSASSNDDIRQMPKIQQHIRDMSYFVAKTDDQLQDLFEEAYNQAETEKQELLLGLCVPHLDIPERISINEINAIDENNPKFLGDKLRERALEHRDRIPDDSVGDGNLVHTVTVSRPLGLFQEDTFCVPLTSEESGVKVFGPNNLEMVREEQIDFLEPNALLPEDADLDHVDVLQDKNCLSELYLPELDDKVVPVLLHTWFFKVLQKPISTY